MAVVATLAGMGNKRVRGELHSVITTGGLMKQLIGTAAFT